MPKIQQTNQTNKKFWNFKIDGEDKSAAELILYGEISSATWRGDEITPKMFDSELSALGNVNEIVVRINSGGGDVFAANAIYTRLKDHKAKITVKIDGWAASAATIIAMAGDVIQIPANGVFMIHNPLIGVAGYYGGDELVKMSEELAVIKQSIINGYCLKTGKSKEEISDLMDKETWLDGNQAVESGFCDEIMFGDAQTQASDANHIVVNSVSIDLSGFTNVPKSLLNRHSSGDITDTEKNRGVKEMEIKNVEELKAAYPEFTEQIEVNAIAAERKRIQNIEKVALPGYEDIVSKAKFETPVDSGALAAQIIAKQKEQSANYLGGVSKDAAESGINEVNSSAAETETNETNPYDAAIDRLFPVK